MKIQLNIISLTFLLANWSCLTAQLSVVCRAVLCALILFGIVCLDWPFTIWLIEGRNEAILSWKPVKTIRFDVVGHVVAIIEV